MGMAKCRKFTMISGECYWDRGRDLNGGNKSFRVEKMTSQWKWILCIRKTHLLLAAAQVCSEAMPLDIICRIVLNTTIIREPVHRGDSIREIIAPLGYLGTPWIPEGGNLWARTCYCALSVEYPWYTYEVQGNQNHWHLSPSGGVGLCASCSMPSCPTTPTTPTNPTNPGPGQHRCRKEDTKKQNVLAKVKG